MFHRALIQQAVSAARSSMSPKYVGSHFQPFLRSFHKSCTKMCSQTVCCRRGLAVSSDPASNASASAAAAAAAAKGGKKSKRSFRRFLFRTILYVSGGAVVYSLIDRSYFHPSIESEVCAHGEISASSLCGLCTISSSCLSPS